MLQTDPPKDAICHTFSLLLLSKPFCLTGTFLHGEPLEGGEGVETLTHDHAASAAWPVPAVSLYSVAAALLAAYASPPPECPSSQ